MVETALPAQQDLAQGSGTVDGGSVDAAWGKLCCNRHIPMETTAVRDRFQTVGSSEVLIADWRGALPAEVRTSMQAVSKLLAARPGRVMVLFQVEGMRWDAKLPFEGVAWMKGISSKMSRVAIAGASGLQLTVLHGMRSLSKFSLPVFATREEAIAWLTRPRKQK